MKLSFKTRAQVEIRKLYKRSNKITQLSRQATAFQRNKISKPTLTQEQTLAGKELTPKRSIPTIVTYPVLGENLVNQISYIEPNQNKSKGLVWINQTQYFENVPPNIWNFCVGNYCVCQKWLSDRKGTTLDRQSIQNYQRLVMLISETIELMNNVDLQLLSSSDIT